MVGTFSSEQRQKREEYILAGWEGLSEWDHC